MPEPDWAGPLNSFLNTVMKSRYGSAEGKLGQQKLALEQQKFDAEQSNHQADMQSRAQQFGQELNMRQAAQTNTEAYQKAMLDETKATRIDAAQERFRQAGGILQPTPTDKSFDLNVAPTTALNPASIMMPQPSTQPVGPTMNLDTAIKSDPGQNLPMQPVQQPPIHMDIPASAQGPDPERYQQTVPPMGTPPGQQAYFPTLKGKVLEAKEATDEANSTTVTPEMEKAFGDLGLKAGDTIDKSMIPMMENAANRRLTRAQQENQFSANQISKQNELDMKLLLGQLAAQKKGDGKSVSDPQATANHNTIMNSSDPAEAYKSLSPLEKSREREMLDNEGVGVPASISAQSKTQETAARNSKAQIGQFEKLLNDPEITNNIGPAMGRYEDLAQGKVGTTVHVSNDPAENDRINQKIQNFRSGLTYMLFSEGKQLMPGRISSQLIGLLKQTSPNPQQALPLLKGSLAAVKENANTFLTSAEKERFNGKVRQNFKENLYPERNKLDGLSKDVQGKIPEGMQINVGGHDIYHDPDDHNFYEVPK